MDQATITRYQPGGDIYATLVSQYGQNAADTLATAARSGDESQVNAALATIRNGAPKDDSLTDALASQLYNDPLGAPLDQAGTILSNTLSAAGNAAKAATNAIIGNWGAWLLVGAVSIGLFFYFGGSAFVRRRISNLK
jgi:hypothetical protein